MIGKICQTCGKHFTVTPTTDRRGGGKFCSNSCRAKKYQHGKTNSNFKGRKTIACEFCGKIFTAVPSLVKNGHARFCSKTCCGKWRSREMVGPKCSFWKGGTTSDMGYIRGCSKSIEWRQSIFLRDDFTCKVCGKRGGDLQAHHIKKFSTLIEEVKKFLPLIPLKEAAFFYSPMWDLSNGITLCEKCHRKQHGVGGNNGAGS